MPHVTYAPAGKKDLPRLREIFLRCFGEEAAPEMELVFSRCGDALWCAKTEGCPAAILAAMPVTLALPQGEYKARYFYGVATHPDFRCRGYAGTLLRHAIQETRARGKAGLVLTCKEKLVPYYARFGFVSEGPSASQHGGAAWYQMRLRV